MLCGIAFEKFGHYEKILGPGGQLKSLSATFSKRLDDGSPEIWFDQQTGTIDHDVVKSWKKHELTSYLKKQYPLHKKLLKGKINLGVHKRDIFFLNESVQAFEKVAKELNTKATFHYAKGSGHNMTPEFTNAMFKKIQQNLKNQQPLPQKRK